MPGTPTTSGAAQRLLLLAKAESVANEWLADLANHGEVRVVRSAREALDALHADPYDYVLTPAAELLPLGAVAGREQARSILDGIAQGVLVLDPQGTLLWTNRALAGYAPETAEAIRNQLAQLIPVFVANPSQTLSRNLSVDCRSFDLHGSTLLDAAGRLERVVGVVTDTTEVTRLHEKLLAIDNAGRELVALGGDDTARMDVPERLELIEDKLIRYCRDLLDFTHFAVFVLDTKANRLDAVLTGGFGRAERLPSLYVGSERSGISGHVVKTGQAYNCPDVAADPHYLPGYEGAKSSLTVPLRLNERVVGVLNVESDEPNAFNDEDRQVAEILGRYIAVALHMLRLLVVERSETTGQFAADVRAEVTEPLEDIVAEATQLLKSDTDPAERARRLEAIIAEVGRVKQTIQQLAEPAKIRGLAPDSQASNPVLAGKHVLVADDEDIIRETISDVLAKSGALTTTAVDGADAVARLGSQHFDLVLSDIKMPHKTGYEVFAAAKEVNRNTPVILITGFGYDPEHSIVRASQEGLAGVLFKPFRVEQLLELVVKALTAAAG